MKLDSRTTRQNKALFLFHEMVATEMKNQWITLDKLILEVQPVPTKDNVHLVFKAILEKMHHKNSTTKMTREEMNNVLDVHLDALSRTWVQIPFPDESKRTLLEFYH